MDSLRRASLQGEDIGQKPTSHRSGPRWSSFALILLALFLLQGCTSETPSILDPNSPETRTIADLFWIMLGLSSGIFLLVVALLIYALFRPRSSAPPPEHRRRVDIWLIGGGGVVLPVIVLTFLMFLTVDALRTLGSERNNPDGMHITVVAHKFWWEVIYPDHGVITANEIHIPVGEVVTIEGTSSDVIHSFWVPQLAGKVDLIPGQINHLSFRADEPGVFRGLCAEYCGVAHARMGFHIVAVPPEDFERWVSGQQQPARLADEGIRAQGQQIFMDAACIACHAVRGTEATARASPDLTHLASRAWIAAATLRNTPDNLARWIAAPHDLKPGVRMPPTALPGEDLQALVEFLDGLE